MAALETLDAEQMERGDIFAAHVYEAMCHCSDQPNAQDILGIALADAKRQGFAAGEARAAALQRERDEQTEMLKGMAVVCEQHRAAIVSLQAEREALFRDVESLMNAVLTTDAKLERLQAQLQAITQEMREKASEPQWDLSTRRVREWADRLSALTERPTVASSTNAIDPVDGETHA